MTFENPFDRIVEDLRALKYKVESREAKITLLEAKNTSFETNSRSLASILRLTLKGKLTLYGFELEFKMVEEILKKTASSNGHGAVMPPVHQHRNHHLLLPVAVSADGQALPAAVFLGLCLPSRL